jgi:quinol monooxygenase YgiN
MGKIHLNGYIDIPEDKRDIAAPYLAEHIRLTRAEAGCKFFDLPPDPQTPGRYFVRESFKDRAAFEAHQTRNHASVWYVFSAGFPRAYDLTEDD